MIFIRTSTQATDTFSKLTMKRLAFPNILNPATIYQHLPPHFRTINSPKSPQQRDVFPQLTNSNNKLPALITGNRNKNGVSGPHKKQWRGCNRISDNLIIAGPCIWKKGITTRAMKSREKKWKMNVCFDGLINGHVSMLQSHFFVWWMDLLWKRFCRKKTHLSL